MVVVGGGVVVGVGGALGVVVGFFGDVFLLRGEMRVCGTVGGGLALSGLAWLGRVVVMGCWSLWRWK